MSNSVVNLMWIDRVFSRDREDEIQIMPEQQRERVKNLVAMHNGSEDLLLWIDKERYTEGELLEIAHWANEHGVELRDLREIDKYKNTELFNESDPKGIRMSQVSLIWRVVDYARVLVMKQTLDEGYEHSIYSDIDITNTPEVLKKLRQEGFVYGNLIEVGPENGLMGFSASKDSQLDDLISRTEHDVLKRGINGWSALKTFILVNKLKDKGVPIVEDERGKYEGVVEPLNSPESVALPEIGGNQGAGYTSP